MLVQLLLQLIVLTREYEFECVFFIFWLALFGIFSRVGNLSVYMGAHNMPPGGDLNFVARFAGDVVIHEGWNRSILLHDIALIRFEVAVPLSGKYHLHEI